jgi:hypothetical protein
VIQRQRLDTGASTTGATAVPLDNTIPQIGEGDQFMAAPAITPSSAANVLRATAQALLSNANAGSFLQMALFFDATNNAYASAIQHAPTATAIYTVPINKSILAAATAATTAKIRAGAQAGTTTFNGGNAAGQIHGGVLNSYVRSRRSWHEHDSRDLPPGQRRPPAPELSGDRSAPSSPRATTSTTHARPALHRRARRPAHASGDRRSSSCRRRTCARRSSWIAWTACSST